MGLFGALGKARDWAYAPASNGAPRLSTIGATLQDVGAAFSQQPMGYLDNLNQRVSERQRMMADLEWQKRQRAQQEQEWSAKQAQNDALNSWVSSLPADQQRIARVDPGAAVKSYYDQQDPTKGVPSGYRKNGDGSLTFIPGGPGDPKVIGRNADARRIDINIGGMNGLSQDGVDLAAQQYRTFGTMPSLGTGSAKAKQMILNRAAEMAKAEGKTAEATVIGQAANTANKQALGQLYKQRVMVGAFEKTFHKNIDVMEGLLPKVNQGGIPVANRWINAGRKSIAGDPDVAAFNTALQTVQAEYAKIMSGSMGNTPVSDSARHHAEELINSAQTPQQLAAVIKVLRQDAANRMSGFDEEEQQLRGSMSSQSDKKPDLIWVPGKGMVKP